MSTVNKITELMSETGFEIVSYGLAPNPNGFCYEVPYERGMDLEARTMMDRLLDQLTRAEEEELKALVFGGE